MLEVMLVISRVFSHFFFCAAFKYMGCFSSLLHSTSGAERINNTSYNGGSVRTLLPEYATGMSTLLNIIKGQIRDPFLKHHNKSHAKCNKMAITNTEEALHETSPMDY